ncbi:MAG: TldD/PmbA family protein [Candidatus Eremiobacteraeota bacterium]|nr:TldD/PmbA family protein [Candidatus Eremiobacteraeota bacterium]
MQSNYRDVLSEALDASAADETEALIMSSEAALTRFTDNAVHENVLEKNVHLSVRVVIGKRVGVASTNRIDRQGIADVVERAARIARVSPADDNFPGLPSGGGDVGALPDAWDAATAAARPQERVEAVAAVGAVMRAHGLSAAGYVATRSGDIGVANTKGIRRFFRSTDAAINIKAIGSDSSGYAEGFSRRFGDLDPTRLAQASAKKAVDGRKPADLEPGAYTVILEPPAFREFLAYLSWVGFGAQPFEQGSSFMSGRIGQPIMGDNITLRDDFSAPLGDGIPFDFEGVPRRCVGLVENGIAKDVVYDSYYAAKLHHPNTGHALPAPNGDGPFPLNIVVEPGASSLDELMADIRRGVLVSRTWYIRLVDQKQTLITGMTRDGFFLIENGLISKPLKNMRFNESIVGALSRCRLADTLVRSENHVLPAARIDGFHFTSGTSF